MASIKVSVMAGTLFTLCVILGTSAHAAYVCCRRYMRGILPFSDITGFSEQKNFELCSINAIIFHTKQGKICANPDLEWVKDYIKRIKQKWRYVTSVQTAVIPDLWCKDNCYDV